MTVTEALNEAPHLTLVERRAISAPSVLNEAFHYERPSSFSRGLRLDLGRLVVLLISSPAPPASARAIHRLTTIRHLRA